MSESRVLHMAVYSIQLYRNAVKIKHLIPDFCLFESNPAAYDFNCFSSRIYKLK